MGILYHKCIIVQLDFKPQYNKLSLWQSQYPVASVHMCMRMLHPATNFTCLYPRVLLTYEIVDLNMMVIFKSVPHTEIWLI